jgi:rifampicin phosphotransferase
VTSWEAPGRGRWSLEVSHFNAVFTVAYRDVYQRGQHDGLKATMARYGVPMSHLAIEFVNDRPYVGIVQLVVPPGRMATRPPPAAAVWLLARLVPVFRRRNRAARRMLKTRLWREDGRRWYEEQKPAAVAANLALQDEDVGALADDSLADHLARAVDNVYRGVRLHFELVAPDSFSVGDFLVAADEWGIGIGDGLSLLAGSSPASADSARLLEAGDIDDYLRHYGWRAVANYDVDSPTIGEMPELLKATITAVAQQPHTDVEPPTDRFRERVPEADRPRFDELLEEARYAYGLRDDNAGITLQWTVGLVRRALLEAGRRLVTRGRLSRPEDTFDLTPAETIALLHGDAVPTVEAVQARVAARRANNALDAPRTMGREDVIPPIRPMPGPMRRVSAAFLIQADLLYSDEDKPLLSGSGVGAATARGPACVVRTAEDAFDRLQPGDILVTPMTTPAYEAVLPMVAGLVVEEGGMLSHAAIVAREFGLPAVIGARGALEHIADGDQVEVDPVAGTVRVVN